MELHLLSIKRIVVFVSSFETKDSKLHPIPIAFCDAQKDFEDNVKQWKKNHTCIYDGPPNQNTTTEE